MKYCLLLLFSCSFLLSYGQDLERSKEDSVIAMYEFTLKDGSRIVGKIQDQNKDSYTIETTNFGTIRIASNQVVSIVLITDKYSKTRTTGGFDNQFGHKYFIMPSAIPIEKNKWHFNNQFLYFSGFSYGISKRVSAGLTFFTFVPTFFVSPSIKLTINPDSKTKFAIRGQYFFVNGDTRNNLGFFQAIVTSGNSQNNVTLSVGKFVSDRGVNDISLVTFGFVKKLSSKLSVISENNIIIGTNTAASRNFGLLSGGFRFDRRMHAFDLGVYIPTASLGTRLLLIPYVGFNLKLNK